MNEQLAESIRQCPNLPTLPSIAMQVLDLAQRPEVDIAEIARLITKDPALSGKILKTVNSSFYARSQNVSTVSQALVILGLQSVKTLVLGFSLVSNLTKSKSKGFKHMTYWRRSIYAATAARTLSAKFGVVQQEEAFLAALLMDIGMLVLDMVCSEEYGVIHTQVTSHAELFEVERRELGMTHAEVGGILCGQWKLPPLLATPITHHHDVENVDDPALHKMTELISLASRCADVFVDEAAAKAIVEVRRFCNAQYQMSEPDVDVMLDEIGKRTKEVASLFEINIGSGSSFEAVLKRANEALVELTLQAQLQATASKQQASQLQEKNQELEKQATTDALTGLSNRARFDAFFREKFEAARSQGAPLALVLMDVDKFKSVNDAHGHPTGDAVLKAVAAIFAKLARPQDLAARYGGEEMVMVLPNTARAEAAAIAERLRRAISQKPVVHKNVTLPITASFGVACLEPGCPLREPAHLLKAADLGVYNAKHSGRNCVRVFALPTKKSPPPPAVAPPMAPVTAPAA